MIELTHTWQAVIVGISVVSKEICGNGLILSPRLGCSGMKALGTGESCGLLVAYDTP